MSKQKGQSEMVGFAIIVIIVSILILIFVSLSLQNNNDISSSSKTESFVQASLQYTTTCERNGVHLDYLYLIQLCDEERMCDDGREACSVLNSTSEELLTSAWRVGEDFPVKGYSFEVMIREKVILNLNEGDVTGTSKGARQTFSGDIQVSLTTYY